jgi:NAD(P) transhydrogenase subunit alpha
MPGPASKLYAQNLVNILALMTTKDDEGGGRFAPDFDDEIVAGACVTHDGQIRHDATREAIEGPAKGDPQ